MHYELLHEGTALASAQQTYEEQMRTVRALGCRRRLGAKSNLAGRYSGPVRYLANGRRITEDDARWRKNDSSHIQSRAMLSAAIR